MTGSRSRDRSADSDSEMVSARTMAAGEAGDDATAAAEDAELGTRVHSVKTLLSFAASHFTFAGLEPLEADETDSWTVEFIESGQFDRVKEPELWQVGRALS